MVARFMLWIAVLALQIYALLDIARTPSDDVRNLPKPIWVLVWLVPLLGPLAWLALGRPQVGPASGSGPAGPGSLGGPRTPRGPSAPDDDPEFLKSLDERSWGERMERLRRERADGTPADHADVDRDDVDAPADPPPAEPNPGPGERPTDTAH